MNLIGLFSIMYKKKNKLGNYIKSETWRFQLTLKNISNFFVIVENYSEFHQLSRFMVHERCKLTVFQISFYP